MNDTSNKEFDYSVSVLSNTGVSVAKDLSDIADWMAQNGHKDLSKETYILALNLYNRSVKRKENDETL